LNFNVLYNFRSTVNEKHLEEKLSSDFDVLKISPQQRDVGAGRTLFNHI